MRMLFASVALVALALVATVAAAGSVERSVPFQLGEWIPLEVTDGPVTLHRLRLVEQSGRLTKSAIFRPGNDEYLQTVQIQLEFTNTATRDWKAALDLVWRDTDGRPIDGYQDDETLDSEERRDIQTVTLSTLKYGLERAARLELSIELRPD